MKKLLLVITIALFTFNVSAQDLKFGAKAGVNFANIGGDDTDGIDSRTSFHIGVVAEIALSEKFSFQPELLYSGQGAKYKESDVDYKYEGTAKVDYLNIPLIAKYYVADGFSLEAGPQIGLLLSANEEWEETFDGMTESGDFDFKDELKGLDFGLNFGVGYKMESGLNFGARYNLGLSNVWDDVEGDWKQNNSVIQLSVGYFF